MAWSCQDEIHKIATGHDEGVSSMPKSMSVASTSSSSFRSSTAVSCVHRTGRSTGVESGETDGSSADSMSGERRTRL